MGRFRFFWRVLGDGNDKAGGNGFKGDFKIEEENSSLTKNDLMSFYSQAQGYLKVRVKVELGTQTYFT